jgi:hypothetical protein
MAKIPKRFENLVRMEYRDLGIPFANVIPPDESAVTSLITGPNKKIYGGTTGLTCHLFTFSPALNRVEPLGIIEGHQSIHHSLVTGSDGMIYAGTGLNEIIQHPISDPVSGIDGIVKSLWKDIEDRYSNYEGGRLYRYDPSSDPVMSHDVNAPCDVEDLGMPVPNEGIYALTASPVKQELYGITYPNGQFFVYDIAYGKFSVKGEICKEKVYGGPLRTLRSLPRVLICDNKGNVYGSADNEYLFKYDIEKAEIVQLGVQFPHIFIAVVEAFVKDKYGMIYGGTSEGFIFKFNPVTCELTNLGKPIEQLGLRALTIGHNGIIYGIAGERNEYCRFFSFDPFQGGYTDFGIVSVDRQPYYSWVGQQFDSMTTGHDGLIYMGESERKSHLFIYYP